MRSEPSILFGERRASPTFCSSRNEPDPRLVGRIGALTRTGPEPCDPASPPEGASCALELAQLCCRYQAEPRPVARELSYQKATLRTYPELRGTAAAHFPGRRPISRAPLYETLEALAGVHQRSVLGDSGVASLYSVTIPEPRDPR
ncbi:hypothetical protein SUZIE_102935 [Sciurus carolinensis]|uniref:Uncharacterized protein n=1 Tax=Sciurus carolinensis TaxID=30640 RepID=A0AA41MCJ3_SCICA|nr:hypothetical protein [Sciurus carolinensis]